VLPTAEKGLFENLFFKKVGISVAIFYSQAKKT